MATALDQLIAQHSPKERADLRHLLRQVQPDEVQAVVRVLQRVPANTRLRLLQNTLAERNSLTSYFGIRRFVPAVPSRLLLIAVAVGLVMVVIVYLPSLRAIAAGCCSWLLSRTPLPEQRPLVPMYKLGTVLEETLKLSEQAAEARLTPPPVDPFRVNRLFDQSLIAEQELDKVKSTYYYMWPYNTPNVDVQRHRTTLSELKRDVSGPVRHAMIHMDAKMTGTLWGMSDTVNITAIDLMRLMDLPDAEVSSLTATIAAASPKRGSWQLIGFFLQLFSSPTTPIPPEANATTKDVAQLRANLVGKRIRQCQAKLLHSSREALAQCKITERALIEPLARYEPAHEYLEAELRARHDAAKSNVTILMRNFNATYDTWLSWAPNTWRASDWRLVSLTGLVFRGDMPPKPPVWDLEDLAAVHRMLEKTYGQLMSTKAHFELLKQLLQRIVGSLENTDDVRAKYLTNKGVPVYDTLAAESAKPMREPEPLLAVETDPQSLLLFLDKTIKEFSRQVREWNGTAYLSDLDKMPKLGAA